MLFFSRWKTIAVLVTAILVCLFAVPNFFPDSVVQRWPAWAQRHIVLGLDLQGGSHLLLEHDSNEVRKEKVHVTIYLVSGVKLSGRIKIFDKYSLILENNNQEQLIFKYAISTVVTARSHPPASARP